MAAAAAVAASSEEGSTEVQAADGLCCPKADLPHLQANNPQWKQSAGLRRENEWGREGPHRSIGAVGVEGERSHCCRNKDIEEGVEDVVVAVAG